tara:strand:- start:400 stop:1011 length:612 start_codon:yes stop_codon:yes gene_type:complete
MKSLRKGIGNRKDVESYYDEWSSSYNETLNKWNYRAPIQSASILKRYIKTKPKYLLDLACGTGLFVEKFLQFFPDCICDGSDISRKILNISKKNGKYRNLYKKNFENKIQLSHKCNLVSLIGAMTYCKNHKSLFKLVSNYLFKNGYFIFTHRTDLWRDQKFDNVLSCLIDFELVHKSKALNYLPKNKDFGSDIKIRIVLLKKK